MPDWQMVRPFHHPHKALHSIFAFYLSTKQVFLLSVPTLFPPGSQFQCDTPAMIDIVLLVDGSWSIGRNNFKLIKEFLSNLISPFSIAEDKIRVGRTCSCFLTLGC